MLIGGPIGGICGEISPFLGRSIGSFWVVLLGLFGSLHIKTGLKSYNGRGQEQVLSWSPRKKREKRSGMWDVGCGM